MRVLQYIIHNYYLLVWVCGRVGEKRWDLRVFSCTLWGHVKSPFFFFFLETREIIEMVVVFAAGLMHE